MPDVSYEGPHPEVFVTELGTIVKRGEVITITSAQLKAIDDVDVKAAKKSKTTETAAGGTEETA